MFLVIGLGNPGPEYLRTRHNAGFLVIDELASRSRTRLMEIKCESYFARTVLAGKSVILAKPLTFMNRSGVAVAALLRYFSAAPEHLLIIYDDMDLPPGKIRLLPQGGSGGHKGVSSIIAHLGSEQFPRLRLGIGRDEKQKIAGRREEQVISHVLSPFQPEEEGLIQDAVKAAADAVELFLSKGIEEAMNRFNAFSPGSR